MDRFWIPAFAGMTLLVAALHAPPSHAHHSYANYDTDTRFVLSGTLTDVQWTNPHILLFVDDGARSWRVEWVTITGAERTDVGREQFKPGAPISIVGSRHRNPQVAVVALVTQIDMPDAGWHWEPITRRSSNP